MGKNSCPSLTNCEWNKTTAAVCISRQALQGKKYLFQDIHNFSFSTKIQDGCQKWQKMKFSPRYRILLYYPGKSLYLLPCQRYFQCFISAKIQDVHQRWRKLKLSPLCIGYSCTTLLVQNSLEIALSLIVFEIFSMFYFPLKSKMATKCGEN